MTLQHVFTHAEQGVTPDVNSSAVPWPQPAQKEALQFGEYRMCFSHHRGLVLFIFVGDKQDGTVLAAIYTIHMYRSFSDKVPLPSNGEGY